MKFFGAIALVSVIYVAAGCSTNDPSLGSEEDESVGQSEAALSTCTSATYNEGLAHYKKAVDYSKARLAQGACGAPHGTMWEIADEASQAVMACGDFRNVIKTSPWAPALREVLAPSLTLRSLTGELLVIRDSQFQNWTGTEALFARGVTFWARSEGAYGPPVQVDFYANGSATWRELRDEPSSGDIASCQLGAQYTIQKTTEAAPRTVRITHSGKTDIYKLSVENPGAYRDAPVFVLIPQTQGAKKLYSLRSECDA